MKSISIANKQLEIGYKSWGEISKHEYLSEDFIREFQNEVDWAWISSCQVLSESFIREFHNKVCWLNIIVYQKLSENFILEFKDYVLWSYISIFQKLSENFIQKYKNLLSRDPVEEYVNWRETATCIKYSEYQIQWLKEVMDLILIKLKSDRNKFIERYNMRTKV